MPTLTSRAPAESRGRRAPAVPPLGAAQAPRGRITVAPTGIERPFADDEIIVSKTDPTGHLTYVNDVFLRVSGFARHELIGAPHSVIRHPDMPRAIFRVLWDGLGAGREVFAYVCNLAADGGHYWVFAHVTPTVDGAGRTVGYHSNRRTVDRTKLPAVQRLYAELRALERRHEQGEGGRRAAVEASTAHLTRLLADRGCSYDEFVWSL